MQRFHALLIAPLAAGAPLFARFTEGAWGLAPCALCLWQRWPYWAAAVLALLAAGTRSRVLLALAGLAILVSAGLGGLHVGVEQGWWPSPLPACAAPAATAPVGGLDAMIAALPARPSKPCDAPTFLVPGVPLSMAAMNLLYALVLGGAALAGAARRR